MKRLCKLDTAVWRLTARFFFGFDFFRVLSRHALEHPLPLMIQLTNMIFQGVFELFPQLRAATPWKLARGGYRL